MTRAREHFPRTPRTQFFESIDGGRGSDLAAEIMLRYRTPLKIYFSKTSFRSLGEGDDIVQGFFASRLSSPGWIADWRDRHESDGMPLRRWLVNALNFYLREEHRRLARDGRIVGLDGAMGRVEAGRDGSSADAGLAAPEAAADRAYESAVSRALVAEALEATRSACLAAGQAVHFEVFERHFVKDASYEVLSAEFGLTPTQCAGCSRTVASKFRSALAEILVREGADPHDLEREIADLMEALRP